MTDPRSFLRRRLLTAVWIAAIGTLLGGCNDVSETPLVVWSNTTDAAFFVERYAAAQDTTVHFRFVEDLTQTLTQERVDADLVIGRWVNTPTVNRLMRPVSEYSAGDSDDQVVTASPRYRRPAVAPAFDELSETWIPLAYTLPTITYLRDAAVATREFSVPFAAISDVIVPINENVEVPPLAPTATAESAYAIYRSLGFRAAVDAAGEPRWQRMELQNALNTVSQWLTDHYGAPMEERRYIEAFLYEPPLRQLESRRVRAVYRDSDELFSWSFLQDERFGFRWLATELETIAVNEDIVYVGIPTASRRSDAAAAFVRWLTTPDVQVRLIADKVEARIDTFGLFGGFSTIPTVNEQIAAVIYPRLLGTIPAPDILIAPGALPRYWNEAINQVIAPFFIDPDDAARLEERVRRWYLQRGD